MQLSSKKILEEGEILHFDKPLTWSSFKLVKYVKKFSKAKKVGHAGTLDPLATGVMIICLGKATKKIEQLQILPKVYSGIIRLGSTTPCFDLEQAIDFTYSTSHITQEAIINCAKSFVGEQFQVPPIFSAVKVNGNRAYKLAREGEIPKLNPKLITITSFEITKILDVDVYFKIACGKGTYIRSIARDFGVALGSGAHLAKLVRESVGDFSIDNCIDLEAFKAVEII